MPWSAEYKPRFQRLGRTVGPDAAPGVQRELEQWWADQGHSADVQVGRVTRDRIRNARP
jgi:hypothetical protein